MASKAVISLSTGLEDAEKVTVAFLVAVGAAETGRPTVQAALTGVTAAFDSRGRLLTWLGSTQRGVAFVRLPLVPGSYLTLFDRVGDTVPLAAIGISALAALVALNHMRRSQRLIGIMVNGNRRPVSPVSLEEATEEERVPDPNEPGGEAAPSRQTGR